MLSIRRFGICLLVSLLGGCASTGTVIVDLGCFWARDIRVSDHDMLTDGTADQILAHNEAWADHCSRQ